MYVVQYLDKYPELQIINNVPPTPGIKQNVHVSNIAHDRRCKDRVDNAVTVLLVAEDDIYLAEVRLHCALHFPPL